MYIIIDCKKTIEDGRAKLIVSMHETKFDARFALDKMRSFRLSDANDGYKIIKVKPFEEDDIKDAMLRKSEYDTYYRTY